MNDIVVYKTEDIKLLSTLICMLSHKGFEEANIMCKIQSIIDNPVKQIKKGDCKNGK